MKFFASVVSSVVLVWPTAASAQPPAPPIPSADRPEGKGRVGDATNVRRALAHLAAVAERNGDRLKDDDLADHFIRELAVFCVREKYSARDFLIALGLGLDRQNFLRTHPLTRVQFAPFDRDEDFARRKPSLGQPTVRGRRDWLLHFVVSATLTAYSDADTAELLGIAKELQDAAGPSGFSFADLAADYAGIAFAEHLLARPEKLQAIAARFRGRDVLPPLDDLEEGLTLRSLRDRFGDAESNRFLTACRAVRVRIAAQEFYRPSKSPEP